MGKDACGEPEGSRLKIELDLTDIELARPKAAVNVSIEAPVVGDVLLESPTTGSRATLVETIREYIDDQDSRHNHARNRIRAERRLVNKCRPSGTSRMPRPSKRGRGRLHW